MGNLSAEIDELGNRTDHAYDAVGRRLSTMQPLVFDPVSSSNVRPETSYEYDANNNQTAVTDANGNRTEYAYDEEDRRTVTTYADLATSSSAYDALGNEISRTDADGLTTDFEYDALNRLVTTTLPSPSTGEPRPVTAYSYDEAGNLVAQTDANGHTTLFEYDLAGNKTARQLPGGQRETFSYDGAGRVTQHTDFNGNASSFEYDVMGRQTKITYADLTTVETTYNDEGQKLTVTDSRGQTSYSYDTRNRLLGVTDPDSTVVSYTYNDIGKKASVTSPGGTTQYGYDSLQRLETVSDPDTGAVTTYGYDPVGNLVSEVKPNGTETIQTYNERNQLTSMVTKKSDGTIITSYQYTVNANGLRTKVTEHDGSVVDYTYDDNYRLVREIRAGTDAYDIQYSYDPVGNRTATNRNGDIISSTYDANDRLQTAGLETYSYDDNGNLTEITEGINTTTYSYDMADRLVQSTDPGGGHTSYTYDAEGNRASKTDATGTVRFILDPNSVSGVEQVLEERDGSDNLKAYYQFGHDLISQYRDGLTSYFHRDGLGSTRALSDGFENVTDTYTYDGYGRTVASSGSTANTNLFAGEHFDPNVGFYYLRARYYDQETGRFISMDPAEGDPQSPTSLHRYLYATDNPVNFVDPTGRQFSLVSVSISISISTNIRSIYTTNLIKFFLKAAKIAECSLRPAYEMQSIGLLMIANNVPGGWELVEQSRKNIAEGFRAIGRAIGETYKNIATDIFKVDIKVDGLLKDLYDAYNSGSVPVPVPEEVAKLEEFRKNLDTWMKRFGHACDAVNAASIGDACGLFTALDDEADFLTGLIPSF